MRLRGCNSIACWAFRVRSLTLSLLTYTRFLQLYVALPLWHAFVVVAVIRCCCKYNECVSLLMRSAWPSSCVRGSVRVMSPQGLTPIMSATKWCAADYPMCAVHLPVCFLHTFKLRLLLLKENLKLHDSSMILSVSA